MMRRAEVRAKANMLIFLQDLRMLGRSCRYEGEGLPGVRAKEVITYEFPSIRRHDGRKVRPDSKGIATPRCTRSLVTCGLDGR